MSHTTYTLRLDPDWDITLDGTGGIAVSGGKRTANSAADLSTANSGNSGTALATSQNVANECRLFTRDAYLAQDQGIPHFLVDLGQRQPESVLRSNLRRAALRVPDVAEVTDITLKDAGSEMRTLTGTIQFTTVAGEHVAIDL